MAVILVLASGTAVSLAVTETDSSDAGANAAVQEETTTEVVETTEDAAGEETTEVAGEETTVAADDDEDAPDAEQMSITLTEQESDGEQVVIDSVTMDEGGFVAVHDQTLIDDGDAVGSVVGTSVYLEAGTHEDVTITLGRTIDETQTLVVMPHQDTNNNQVFDFVISAGEVDGPYTATDGDAVVDQATVSVGEEPAETEEAEETEVVETEEPEETEVLTEEPEETTEVLTEEPEETEEVEETTEVLTEEPEETEVVETEEPEEPEETTEVLTEEPEETTEVLEETTPAETDVEEPTDQQQFVFKAEQMSIDRWSFVVGDEETPDRTETVSDISVSDRRVEINLTEVMQQQAEMEGQFTTQDPEEAQEQLEENLSQDLETVRFVIENVNVENVTLVVTAPADMELPEQPGMGPEMTTEEEEEDVVEETTAEEDVVEETTVEEEEEDVVVETTAEEDEEDVIEETTPEADEEDAVEETTVEEDGEDVVEQTTTEAPELDSFDVDSIDAPESADVGDTVTVSADVTNPNEVEATQQVELRLDGDVVERQAVTIEGGDQQTVTFELDTSNASEGEYAHGVFTRDFGEVAIITLSEPTADGAETEVPEDDETEVVETETPDVEETTEVIETETPDVNETTEVVETTVEG